MKKHQTLALLAALLLAVVAACTTAKDPTAIAAKSALLAAYELRLDAVGDNTPGTCPDVVEALRKEELAWAPIWKGLNINPQPPRQLLCPNP